MLIPGIILKNSWCNSLPGPLRCSRDQSSHILKLDVFQLLPAESFSCPPLLADCLQMHLLLYPNSPPLTGADVCSVSSMSALTYKGQRWNEMGEKKKRECISVVVWYVIGGGIQTETARERCLKAYNNNLCKATTSGQNGCDRKAAMKAGSRASELRLSWWRSRAPPLWWTLSPCGAAHFRNDLLHPC